MKKLFVIFAFLFVAFSLNAQDKTISGSGVAGKIFFPDTGINHGFATHMRVRLLLTITRFS
jgi:hypothetical protein